MDTVYLDNAATSFPKPAGMSARMKDYMDNIGATINRSVYASAADAGLVALSLRERAKRLFNFNEKATHVIITPGATAGLNFIIKGLLRAGEHCIVSSMEHNAVMRPIMQLDGVEFSRIPCDGEGRIIPNTLEPLIRPNTRLVIMAHGSNVCGTVQDAEAVGKVCKEHNIPFALDAAQTAGHYPVDFGAFNLSALAVPGHKGLLGPMGTGILAAQKPEILKPVLFGGTGSFSLDFAQPQDMPERLESGTLNVPGICGLSAGIEKIASEGEAAVAKREMQLAQMIYAELLSMNNVTLFTPFPDEKGFAPVISFVIGDLTGEQTAAALAEKGAAARGGFHCAALAHRKMGTENRGTCRISIGPMNTFDEAMKLVRIIYFAAKEN